MKALKHRALAHRSALPDGSVPPRSNGSPELILCLSAFRLNFGVCRKVVTRISSQISRMLLPRCGSRVIFAACAYGSAAGRFGTQVALLNGRRAKQKGDGRYEV